MGFEQCCLVGVWVMIVPLVVHIMKYFIMDHVLEISIFLIFVNYIDDYFYIVHLCLMW